MIIFHSVEKSEISLLKNAPKINYRNNVMITPALKKSIRSRGKCQKLLTTGCLTNRITIIFYLK